MRIESSQGTPPWLNTRDQIRMIAIVLGLGLILLLIKVSSQPAFWKVLFPDDADGAAPTGESELNEYAINEISRTSRRPLRRDEFVSPTEPPHPVGTRPAGMESGTVLPRISRVVGEVPLGALRAPADGEGVQTPRELRSTRKKTTRPGTFLSPYRAGASRPPSAARQDGTAVDAFDDAAASLDNRHETGKSAPAGVIDSTVLSGVTDNTIGIRAAEFNAWLHVLDHARRLAPADLAAAAEDVSYAVLMVRPERYRGKVLSFNGDLRRLSRLPVEDNERGITDLYDAWVFTTDSGNRPYHVICSEVSASLPVMNADYDDPIPVRINGYFFKREGYASRGGLKPAPLILAGRIDAVRSAPAVRADTEMIPWLWGFAVVVALSIGITLWSFSISDRRYRSSRAHTITQLPRHVNLEGIDAEEPGNVLSELADDPERALRDV